MSYISQCIQDMNHYFYTRKTYDIQLRLYYLKKLKKTILNHQKEIETALLKDFKKPAFETYATEIYTTISELNHTLRNISKWSNLNVHSGILPVIGSHTTVMKEPYGIVLLFSPYNYPFHLVMMPLIGAIAAGNCVIIKPSEYTPYTNKILQEILNQVFPPYYVLLIEGNDKVCKQLLNEPIDYVFFTGGIENGKKVMKQAAEHLIPVTLELGGKSPVIVDSTADIRLAAIRIVWGKFLNAGQTCIAPDYILVQESVAKRLLCAIGFVLQHFYKEKKDMAHIINEAHYVRLLQLINEDKIYFGGHFNTDDLYIEPTILYPISPSDLCMQEEIFGPILPVIPYKRLQEAVYYVQRYPKPLACYIFSNNQRHIDYLLKSLSFGGGCINDTILHAIHPQTPFGGVGYSGMGSYHGYHSFKTFTHEKTIFYSTTQEIPLRYPPYTRQLKWLKKLIR